jgi:outer membrane receptor protein involved in Fe transport
VRWGGIVLLALAAPAAAQTAPSARDTARADTTLYHLPALTVSLSRLGVGGVPLARLPFGAEVVRAERSGGGARTVADLLAGVGGITLADQFGSAFQPEVRFRGFQVGPVVGVPQSVSVFIDGVRVNEPDASQVNFDLLPLQAVERIEVVRAPGGAFGRNTLAGSINLVTRRGEGRASGGAELSAGRFGTRDATGWAGGEVGAVHYLASGRAQRSEGWRALNRSELASLYPKLGVEGERGGAWLSYTFAENHLQGPGSLPRSWLVGELPPELAGTHDPRRLQFTGFEGDYFAPRLHFATLGAERRLGARDLLQANAFVRRNRFTQFNDNITEPNARGETRVLSHGATLEWSRTTSTGARLGAGAEYASNDVDVQIYSEPNRAFPGEREQTADVGTVDRNLAAFATLWWPLSARWGASGALRYDYVHLPFTDRLEPENGGDNHFRQVTGSLGADWELAPPLRAFASYGRGFRAPVILELACADPEDPCPLPFELGADPPLDPVTTDTWQAGVRWFGARDTRVEVLGYRAEVYDDLFAVIAPPSTRGYFRNLDRTRREGLELSLTSAPWPRLELSGSLALTRAIFRSKALLANALADDDDDDGDDDDTEGGVRVQPGDRFAMVPALAWSAGLTCRPGAWRLGVEARYTGSQFFVGDESNTRTHGVLAPHLVLDARVEHRWRGIQAYVAVRNLLNTRYNTFGMIAPNVRGPNHEMQPFLSPAPPRWVTVGVGL